MSLFRSSAETGKDVRSKILLWGPPGSGKSHFALGAPRPALLDLENRGRNFAARSGEFAFTHAEIATLHDLGIAFKELRSGAIDCDTIITDSGSAIYFKLVQEHTVRVEREGRVTYVTDWVTVNRRFLDCLNFVFEIVGKNVIFTAHAATKLVRDGRDFKVAGLKFVGDERFRFGFDYIFRLEPQGHDPAATVFHVEKTSSPALKDGQAVRGLTWAKFRELTGGTPTPQPAPAPRQPLQDDGTPLSTEQRDKIEVLERRLQLGTMALANVVKRVTRRTPQYQQATAAEASRIIAILEQQLKGAA